MLSAINAVRTAHRVTPLRIDARLERAARSHSHDMMRNNYFAHGAFALRMSRFGASGPFLGENLAWGTGNLVTSRSIVRQWLGSPGHRANLLRAGFRRIGVAAPIGRFAGFARAIVVTADFGGY